MIRSELGLGTPKQYGEVTGPAMIKKQQQQQYAMMQ
jgi:hypothetical protein